ncbi:site-specific integrase, partial [Spongiactinospora gelatinilytica]
MSHIEDRWYRKARGPDGKILLNDRGKPVMEKDPQRYGKGKRWRLRLEGGRPSESFATKTAIDARKKIVDAEVLTDTYIDPNAGKITFEEHARGVIKTRSLDPASRELIEQRMEDHVYPVIGATAIGELSKRPSRIQALINTMEKKGLSPNTIDGTMSYVNLAFAAAVEDELIRKNPCRSSTISLPKIIERKIVVWTPEQVFAMAEHLHARYSAVVAAGAGIGLRLGEILGLGPDDIDWELDVVHVRRQLKMLKGADRKSVMVFAPPKGGKERDVPLAGLVKLLLVEHMRLYPPIEVKLPWGRVDGELVAARLFFSTSRGRPVRDSTFRPTWRSALRRAGIVPKLAKGQSGAAFREHGPHMLRRYFASVLMAKGESPKAVSLWMGHGDGGVLLLRTYAHLMPSSVQQMRASIDRALPLAPT